MKCIALNFIIFLFYISFNTAIGQILEWSNTQKLRGNSLYTTVVGEDESGIYVFKHKNKFLSKFLVMERYRHNLGLENSKSFLLKDTRILYANLNENGLLIIKQVFDKKSSTYTVNASYLNSSFENIIPETNLIEVKSNDTYDEPIFIIKPSSKNNYYFIFNLDASTLKKNKSKYVCIDQKLNVIKNENLDLDLSLNIESISEIVIDNNLNFCMLAKLIENKKNKQNFAIIEQTDTSTEFKIVSDSFSCLNNMRIFYNPLKDQKGISGFYSPNKEEGFVGDFSYQWQSLLKENIKIIKHPFSTSILRELEGEASAHSGLLPNSYQCIKLICRSDGGFLKLSENSFIQKSQDIMVINGVQSAQGRSIYIYENILVQNFDSTGNLAWESWIAKNQNTVNDGGMLGSAFVLATESSINVLFNDPIAAGGDILVASFLPSGERDIKVLVKGDEMNAFILPMEGIQISKDKIIVPVSKDRKFALLKITFKQ